MIAASEIGQEEEEEEEEEEEASRSMITFNTDATSLGGTVYNINRDYNVHFNLLPGCAPPEAMNQILRHIHAASSSASRSVAQLRRLSEPPSDQITKIYVADDPFYNSAILSIERVRVMISIVQTMMANPMLCPSKDLPVTLASLERLLTLMKLALRAYRHTDLVHSLSNAISIGVEECRRLLDELISNLTSFRHGLSNAVLYFIRKYMWARIGWQGSAVSALDSKLRKSHSSFAACLLALGRAAWPELKRGREQETLNELAKFYVQLEQESTSLRRIKVDAVIVQDHLGRSLPVPMIFCTSSHDFHVVITGFCRGVAGDILIQRGNYRILNSKDDQVINPEEFAIVLRPGMAVGMSIALHERAEERQGSEGHSCPRCKHINARCTGWVTCTKCNCSFKISPEEEFIVSPETEQRAGADSIPNERFLFRKISIFQRKRNNMVYNDRLDDRQFAMASEDGEDFQDVGRKRDDRAAQLVEDAFNRGTSMSDSESRGRKGTSKTNDHEPASVERKRGAKAMSVTSPLDKDDDDDRDRKRRKTKAGDLPADQMTRDVEKDLPDKVEKIIKVRMSALQSQLYKQMKKHKMIADDQDSKGKAAGVKGLSNELMQLRKICQHPFLFESVEDRMNPSGMIDDKLVRSSGKLELLSRILPKFFATGHRVLIFFQMTKVMDIMEDFMKMMGYQYLRLDGGTKTEERASYVQMFNEKDSEIKVFILSTRAGGLGLNLQTADTVIIFDSDWNPHADLQAQYLAHRIGQTKAVRILRFVTEKSVEEAMFARARFKLGIGDKVIKAGRFDNKSTQEEQEEFLRSILEAGQEEENEEAGDMNDDELNEMLARDENEAEVFRDFDVARDRQQLEAWRAAGNRGKPPTGLMQFDELPKCYQVDEPFEVETIVEGTENRGQRKRDDAVYNNALNDKQSAMAPEDGEDLEDDGRKRGGRAAPLVEDHSNRGTSNSDSESRGRKSKKGKSKTNDYEPAVVKRKRGANAMSVTPSLDEDDDEDRDAKRLKTKVGDLPAAVRDRMKKAFLECHTVVMRCEDGTGRKRCELFKELPAKRDYPDYYKLIKKPIALSHIRKRISSNTYKNVAAYKDDWWLVFNNARTYNQEGSWVYIDAEEMEKAFEGAWDRYVVGSGLPGAPDGTPVVATRPIGYDHMDGDYQHPKRP